MQKKGQFYIISTLIIIAVIIGLVTAVNYIKKPKEPVKFYDLSEDYEAETTKIVDYGVYSKQNVPVEIEEFTEKFSEYAEEKDPNVQIIYLYGDKDNLQVFNYGKEEAKVISSSTGTTIPGGSIETMSKINVEYGEQQFSRDVEEKMKYFKNIKETISSAGQWIQIEIAGIVHNFNLADEDNFYYILKTESGKEVHIKQT